MVKLALVHALVATAAHVGHLARWQTLSSVLLRRVCLPSSVRHGLVDRRASLSVHVLTAEAQRIIRKILAGVGCLLRAARDEA